MNRQAKIFLAEERGVTETGWFRSYSTFNFGNYYNEHKTAAGKLYVCNDDILAGGKSFSLSVDEDTLLYILPVAGAVSYRKNDCEAQLINSGEVFSAFLFKGDVFEISNPYEHELVNFLQLWIKKGGTGAVKEELVAFDINAAKNTLIHIPVAIPFSIAKLDGRNEVVYTAKAKNNCLFAFVIQGAFETEGILLHPKDAVALWNYAQVEMEALSNDAVIVLIEMDSN